MSCSDSKSPANISKSKILNDCNLKCSYNYKYQNSNCNVTNKNTYLKLSYDYKANQKQCVFNNSEMVIEEVRIYSPSLHTFDGIHSDAELIIVHRGKPRAFLVCIPIVKGSITSDASNILEFIINEASSKIPNVDEKTTVNINNYNLDKIIPRKPYYSYLGNIPYDALCSETDYVVYDTTNAIQLNNAVLKKLNKMIVNSNIPVVSNTNLFYNIRGPNSNQSEDDIYIDCKPVDQNGELLISENETQNTSDNNDMDFSDFTNSIFFKILIGLIIAYVIYKLAMFLIKKLGTSSSKIIPKTGGGKIKFPKIKK